MSFIRRYMSLSDTKYARTETSAPAPFPYIFHFIRECDNDIIDKDRIANEAHILCKTDMSSIKISSNGKVTRHTLVDFLQERLVFEVPINMGTNG